MGVRSSSSSPSTGFLSDLWNTKAWRLFPLILVFVSTYTVMSPIKPMIMTDFFASRHAHEFVKCEDFSHEDQPKACQDAHSDSVLWEAWSSFVANSIFSFMLAPMVGSWSDAYGRKPFLILAMSCVSVPALIFLLHINFGTSLYYYFPAQAVSGALSSISISLAFMADLLTASHRAAAFGAVLACFSMGLLVGPTLGSILSPLQASIAAFGGLLGCVAYVIVVLPESLTPEELQRARREQEGGSKGGMSAWQRWSSMRILLRSQLFKRLTVVYMLTGIVSQGLMELLTQYLQIKLSFNTKDQAYMFITYGLCGLLVQTVILRALLSGLGEKYVLLLGMSMSLLNQVTLALATNKAMAFGSFLLGSLGHVSIPAISGIKSNNVSDSEQGTVQGALQGAQALAMGVGPIVFSIIFSAFSRTDSPFPYFPGAPFLFGALLMLIAICIASTIDKNAGQGIHHEVVVSGSDEDLEEEALLSPDFDEKPSFSGRSREGLGVVGRRNSGGPTPVLGFLEADQGGEGNSAANPELSASNGSWKPPDKGRERNAGTSGLADIEKGEISPAARVIER